MKWSPQGWGCLTAMVLGAVAAGDCLADTANPYESIVDRNPFGLRPPPPPPDPAATAPPPAPPATVELTGITSIFQKHKALLEITPGPGKPVLKPILMEGERLESVEVVSINVEKNEVTIRNGSLTTNLSLKVPKPGGAPATPAPPNHPAMAAGFNPAAFAPPPPPGGAATPQVFTPNNAGLGSGGRGNVVVFGANNATAPAAGGGPGVATFGGQPVAPTPYGAAGTPGATAFGSSSVNLNPGASAADSAFRGIPSRTVRAQQQQPQTQGQVDPAVQYINMKAQEIQAKQQGKPFPPLPPIPGLDLE